MTARSLQQRLTLTLCGATLVLAAVAAAFSARIAWKENQALQDDMLRLAAYVPEEGRPPPPREFDRRRPDLPSVLLQPPHEGEMQLPDGYHELRRNGKRYRAFVHTRADKRRIAALQALDARNRSAAVAALHGAMPLLVLIPISALLIALICRRLFRRVNRLAQTLDARTESDNSPIDTRELPLEIQSYTRAINRLLARNAQTIAAQERFIADAAHELRTPLAVLTLQAERLAGYDLPTAAKEELHGLQKSLQRNRELVAQLLTLARSRHHTLSEGEADVQAVFRDVLQDLLPLAEAKGCDLGIAGAENATAPLPAADLYTALKNLCDNAIRYTPRGSRIDLHCERDENTVRISVEDNGDGVEASARATLADPFVRLLGSGEEGSGLGLTIVAALAEKFGGSLTLTDARHFSHGLRATLHFPVPDASKHKN